MEGVSPDARFGGSSQVTGRVHCGSSQIAVGGAVGVVGGVGVVVGVLGLR